MNTASQPQETIRASFDLFAEMEKVDIGILDGSLKPVQPGEIVVGIMGEGLTKVFCVRLSMVRRINEKVTLLNQGIDELLQLEMDPNNRDALEDRQDELQEEIERTRLLIGYVEGILGGLFAMEFPVLIEHPFSVNVREGGQVVYLKENPRVLTLRMTVGRPGQPSANGGSLEEFFSYLFSDASKRNGGKSS